MADGIRLVIEEDGLDRFVELANKAMALAIEYTAQDVWGGIRKYAPVDTGRLAGSFQMVKQSSLSWSIYTSVHYALYVHEGTGIYGPSGQPIVPTTAKALKFFWKKTGQTMIFKGDLPSSFERARFAGWAEERGMSSVFAWVKGQEPQRFADKAIDEAYARTDSYIQKAVRETVG